MTRLFEWLRNANSSFWNMDAPTQIYMGSTLGIC